MDSRDSFRYSLLTLSSSSSFPTILSPRVPFLARWFLTTHGTKRGKGVALVTCVNSGSFGIHCDVVLYFLTRNNRKTNGRTILDKSHRSQCPGITGPNYIRPSIPPFPYIITRGSSLPRGNLVEASLIS